MTQSAETVADGESPTNLPVRIGAEAVPGRLGEGLAVEGVVHAYSGAPAVQDVGFAVPAAGVAAILGPSGCGKSTMLRIIAGLVRPKAGRVRIGARDVTEVPARERRVGMVFQNYALFPHMTVAENVGYGLTALSRAERKARVEQLLALVRLETYADRLPRQLSGGQQQRVAVARALAPRPALLLLDEPFAALDRALRADMQFEFLRIQRELGITTILVTHDQEEAQAVADTLIVMNAGRVEQVGTPAELYDRPRTLFVNTFVGQASVLRATVVDYGQSSAVVGLSTGERLALDRRVGFTPGAPIALVVRPEHVTLHAEPVAGAVRARRILSVPQGPLLMHDLVLADGTALKAVAQRLPHAPAPPPEEDVFVTFALDHCQIFPASCSLHPIRKVTPMSATILSRRHVLAALAGTAALPMFGAGNARAAGSIVAAAFPGSWEDAYRAIIAPLVAKQGTELVISPALAQDQLAKLLASQGKPAYDTVMMSPGQTTEAVAKGLIEKIDPSKLKNWSKLPKSAQTEYGPNVTVEITGIAYNPTKVPKPSTYKDLFENPAYDGKVAWLGFGSNTATLAWIEVAKAFGGGEDNIEPAFKMLAKHLAKVGAIANNGNQQMSLFQQGEVAVFMASTGNVARLKSLGVPCEFVHPTTGSPALPVALHLAKGSANAEGVYQYMDAVISAEAQTKLAEPPTEMIPTNVDVPLTASIKNYVTDADIKNLIYPNWAKINPNRAAWTTEFDKIVKK